MAMTLQEMEASLQQLAASNKKLAAENEQLKKAPKAKEDDRPLVLTIEDGKYNDAEGVPYVQFAFSGPYRPFRLGTGKLVKILTQQDGVLAALEQAGIDVSEISPVDASAISIVDTRARR